VIEVGGKAGVAQRLGSQDVPFYDRYYLGGQYDLRGFDYRGVGPRAVTQDGGLYEPIGGDTYWLGSIEYSIPIISRLRFALFYDIGNVSAQPWNNSGYNVPARVINVAPPNPSFGANGIAGNTGDYSDNYGIGLRLDLPIGPLRLDYGIPIQHDTFSSSGGKFQFSVGFSRPF
jgi:outer membrane protein insertion porin family